MTGILTSSKRNSENPLVQVPQSESLILPRNNPLLPGPPAWPVALPPSEA